MPLKIIFLFFCLFLTQNLLSQNTDSILNIIENTDNETTLSDNYYKLGKSYKNLKKYDKSLEAFTKSFEISKLQLDYDLMSKNLLEMGIIHNFSYNKQEALNAFQEIFLYENEISDKTILAEACNEIGITYYSLSYFDKALDFFEKSKNYNEIIDDELGQAQALTNIAVIYDIKGELDKSLENYTTALKIFEEKNNIKGIAYIYNNMGLIYKDVEDFSKALDFFDKSLKYKIELKDSVSFGDSYNNIGVVYKAMNNLDSALLYFSKGYEANLLATNKIGTAKSLNNIGTIYKDKKEFTKALEYFNKAMEIRIEIADYSNFSSAYINIGETYSELGNNNFALEYLQKATVNADSLKIIDNQILCYEALYKFYSKNYDYEKALENYIIYSNLQDTLLNQQKINQITELQIVYETEKKQKELELLQSDNLIQKQKVLNNRYIAIAGVLFSVVILLLLFMYFRQQKLKNDNKTMLLEHKLLRSQMNPHFIFNSLMAIQSFLFENNSIQASKYLNDFAKLIRLILENSIEEFITFEKEIQTLEYYLKLQQLRFDNKFDYQINIDDDINPDNVFIPPMLSQPIIENAIEHGIRDIKEKGLIQIIFENNQNYFTISVIDNGIGINKSLQKKNEKSVHKSIALEILKERLLKYLPKNLAEIQVLDLEQQNNKTGTKIKFNIPLKNSKNVKIDNN